MRGWSLFHGQAAACNKTTIVVMPRGSSRQAKRPVDQRRVAARVAEGDRRRAVVAT